MSALEPRVDTASRVIEASAGAVYDAWMDAEALAAWLPPEGMTAAVHLLEPVPGGRFRVELTYRDATMAGKSSAHSDIVEGRFVELVAGERIVQHIDFESDDPAFAGTMTMDWTLAPEDGGTRVTVSATNVPGGIRPEDHAAGMASTLANLAGYLERR